MKWILVLSLFFPLLGQADVGEDRVEFKKQLLDRNAVLVSNALNAIGEEASSIEELKQALLNCFINPKDFLECMTWSRVASFEGKHASYYVKHNVCRRNQPSACRPNLHLFLRLKHEQSFDEYGNYKNCSSTHVLDISDADAHLRRYSTYNQESDLFSTYWMDIHNAATNQKIIRLPLKLADMPKTSYISEGKCPVQ